MGRVQTASNFFALDYFFSMSRQGGEMLERSNLSVDVCCMRAAGCEE